MPFDKIQIPELPKKELKSKIPKRLNTKLKNEQSSEKDIYHSMSSMNLYDSKVFKSNEVIQDKSNDEDNNKEELVEYRAAAEEVKSNAEIVPKIVKNKNLTYDTSYLKPPPPFHGYNIDAINVHVVSGRGPIRKYHAKCVVRYPM